GSSGLLDFRSIFGGEWNAAGTRVVFEPAVAKAICFFGTVKSSLGFVDGFLCVGEVAFNEMGALR
ncbi:MAG: hypothetical protein OIF35_12385, partial [Cellvibrionaceae bacterium]|nr:hypothetical protein [Cellvibrionaceae bacterium]